MTDPALTGHAVIEQSRDNGLWNTNPAIATGAIVGIIGAVGSILVIGGYIDESQSQALKDSAGQIVPALFIIFAVIQAAWTRAKVYSPKTAASIAVENARATTTVPTLAPPP